MTAQKADFLIHIAIALNYMIFCLHSFSNHFQKIFYQLCFFSLWFLNFGPNNLVSKQPSVSVFMQEIAEIYSFFFFPYSSWSSLRNSYQVVSYSFVIPISSTSYSSVDPATEQPAFSNSFSWYLLGKVLVFFPLLTSLSKDSSRLQE